MKYVAGLLYLLAAWSFYAIAVILGNVAAGIIVSFLIAAAGVTIHTSRRHGLDSAVENLWETVCRTFACIRSSNSRRSKDLHASPDVLATNELPLFEDDARFTVYQPQQIQADVWYKMLVFAHRSNEVSLPDDKIVQPIIEVERQARKSLGSSFKIYDQYGSASSGPVETGSTLTFVPDVSGVTFDPESLSLKWQDVINSCNFDLKADANTSRRQLRGCLRAFAGPLIIGEVPLSFTVSDSAPAVEQTVAPSTCRVFRKIFPSYSRKDAGIVNSVRKIIETTGDRFLQDVIELRSGEEWAPGIERLIGQADIFQLFWSWHSMVSPEVRREWEYALSLSRPNFVRPLFWENPLPKLPDRDLPPRELQELHFSELPNFASAMRGKPTTVRKKDLQTTMDRHGKDGAIAKSDVQLILKKVSTGDQVPVSDGLVAGRLEECGLVLTDGHPSRQHARFNVSGKQLQVEDLGSSNGTFVNDQRISGAVVLRSGDRIRFDIEEYEYQVVGEANQMQDAQATTIRQVESEDVDIDGSQERERPAWIDPEKQAAGGPRTEFIDAAAMKEMIQVNQQQGGADLADDVETPMLLVTSGEKKGQRFNLRSSGERGEWTIGCDSDPDIMIPDQGVSGIHAKLVRDGKRWKLTDQMSANGTFVNGRRSSMSYLDNGDRIRFGPVDCLFRTPDAFGTVTMVSSVDEKRSNVRNIVLALLGFIVTLAIIIFAMRFL